MPLVSITRPRVRSLRYLPAFLQRSAREAKHAPGNLAVTRLSDANLAFWTRTIWTDEQSMRGFLLAQAHRSVMPKLLQWCDEAAVTHWLQDLLEPPSWREVHRDLHNSDLNQVAASIRSLRSARPSSRLATITPGLQSIFPNHSLLFNARRRQRCDIAYKNYWRPRRAIEVERKSLS